MEKEPSRRKFVQNFPKKTSPAGATPKANAKVWGDSRSRGFVLQSQQPMS
jgi:hypothetical protein